MSGFGRRSGSELPLAVARRLPFAGAILAAVIASGALYGQRQQPPSRAFSEVIEVRVVNLEVVVTDREGNRVSGLGIDDFELLVDGEVVPIEYFTEIADGVVRRPPTEPGGGERRDVPGLSGEGYLRTHYLLFIDEFFSIRRDRDRVLDGILQGLDGLGDQDRMAVVRYDGRDLEMLTTWTGDRAALRQALESAKGRSSGGLQRLAELRQHDFAAQRGDLDLGGVGFGQLGVEERYYVDRITEQIERVVTAAVSTMRGFAAPPGRKVMLLLAGGWPYDPAEYVVDNTARSITEVGVERGEELLSPLTDTANLLGYTLYPIDVPGFQTTAVDAGVSVDSLAATLGSSSFLRETGVHQTLYHLAGETGGVAIVNRDRVDGLARVIADTRSFYWLGYTPQRRGDDERHDVEVRVKRAGLQVRGREGYFDFSRQREVTLAVESALYFGAPASAQPLGLRIGRGKRSGLRTMRVPVEIRIPAESVTFLPTAAGVGAQLELRVAVLDERGGTADIPVIPLVFELEEEPPDGVHLRYATELKMRRQQHDLVVAIYDLPSGTILSTSVEVQP